MACTHIMGCDLCDAIGMGGDPQFEAVAVFVGSDKQHATLCPRCIAPLVEIAQRLQERDAQKMLDGRIFSAMKEGKI